MTGYLLLTPELALLVAAAWAMFADRLPGGDRGAAWASAGLATVSAVLAAVTAPSGTLFAGLLGFDGPGRFARVGMAVLLALWLVWVGSRSEGRVREAVALASFATLGGMLMTEARELVTLVLAIELATMPAYVLIGYRRERIAGLEGAIKYFLLSMLTTLVMLYGMSFLYGASGTTRFDGLDMTAAGTLGIVGVLLTFVGLFAKLSAAPFHYWAPDAYEGSEAWTVAFVSTVPKVAGAVVLVRLASVLSVSVESLSVVLLAGAVASMVLGNLAALTQTDVRRLMAYSGVAHTGYLMLGVAALTSRGYSAAILYAVAYALPSLGVMLIVAEEGAGVRDFAGVARRRPATAWALVLMLASLIGIPPMIGFFGKLFLFAAALEAKLWIWVLVAILMSVVSAGYYLRLVREAFFGEPAREVAASSPISAAVAIAAALTLALGLAAGPLLTWIAG